MSAVIRLNDDQIEAARFYLMKGLDAENHEKLAAAPGCGMAAKLRVEREDINRQIRQEHLETVLAAFL